MLTVQVQYDNSSKYSSDNSSCIRDISRLSAERSEGIPKHAQQFWKQAGGVPLQERSPAA